MAEKRYNEKCPIWDVDCEVETRRGDFETVHSVRAGGKYIVTGTALQLLRGWSGADNAKRVALSQSILEANLNGSSLTITSDDIKADSKLSKKLTVTESLGLFLRAANSLTAMFGESFVDFGLLDPDIPTPLAIASGWPTAEINTKCIPSILTFLKAGEAKGVFESERREFSITFEGFEVLETIGISGKDSPSIFVAMWFGDKAVNKFYQQVVCPAVEGAGYNCIRIDETFHNERIDEQILAEIRKSHAVIVDVTCGLAKPEAWSAAPQVGAPRGGVYFEAGFAVGLGKPIIWTVNGSLADIENVVHFDVRQYNQLRWGDNFEESRALLQARIESTLGHGKNN